DFHVTGVQTCAVPILLKVAAQRVLRQTEPIQVLDNSYEKFSAGFPYAETEDQQRAIEHVLADLEKDQVMDRLVYGDVGFGKTEESGRASCRDRAVMWV